MQIKYRGLAHSLPLLFLALTGCVSSEREQLKGQLCEKWFNKSIPETQIVARLGLYMPKSIDNARPFRLQEIDGYCKDVLE
jgi:hypothetical protein